MSIRAIAERVGVTPPSIYLHFADKEELIRSVCGIHFARFASQLEAAVAGVDDPVEALRRRGRAYVQYGVDNPEHYRILFMGRYGSEIAREDFESGRVPGADSFMALVANVAACMETGAFGPDDPFRVATGVWALVHGITSLRVSSPSFPGLGDEELLDHILAMAARGLAPLSPKERRAP